MYGGEIGRGRDKKKEEMDEAGDYRLHAAYHEKEEFFSVAGRSLK